MAGVWPNRVLPGILAIALARLFYVAFAQGPISVLIVFGLSIGLLPTLYFLAVHGVGFVFGLMGRRPSTMTKWFESGWTKGTLRPWRANG
jgi:hypothetical protein